MLHSALGPAQHASRMHATQLSRKKKEKSSMFHSVLSQHCRYQSCNRSKKLILLNTSNNGRTATGRKRGSYSHVAHQLWETPPPPQPPHTPLDASNNSRTRLQQEGKEGLILVFQSAEGDPKNTPLDPSNNSMTARLQQEGKGGVPVSCGRPQKYPSRP